MRWTADDEEPAAIEVASEFDEDDEATDQTAGEQQVSEYESTSENETDEVTVVDVTDTPHREAMVSDVSPTLGRPLRPC